MKVSVDEVKCVGGGHCAIAAEEVFDQRDEDGIVVLLDPAPPACLHDKVREAAMLCPAAAIHIEDAT
ncbi:ferredoxin [Amycolatopsis taiwanensis]|uniref:Ferredoxin n=1 Tax=Amycolatopsis taiwanensis TaxID=342230 RepID=A0A9W6R8R1_9PSEU|nr:ferredoxin [Amycolatopsis taiwanensis]GLY71129.1 ferredoxin [Amycolatopsis taiwanensis]